MSAIVNGLDDCSSADEKNCVQQGAGDWRIKEDFYYPAADHLSHLMIKLGLLSEWSLASAYEEGFIVKQSYEKAFKLLLSLGNNKYPYGQYGVGYYYAHGIHVEQNYDTAVAWLKLAANQGITSAKIELARIFKTDSYPDVNYDTAFEWANMALEEHDIEAYNLLAELYEYGKGVPKDLGEAFRLWKLAAEKGSLNGMFKLGIAYQYAKGVERDYLQAIDWFKRASEQNNSDATYQLGLAYINGMGVAKELDKGISLIFQSAEQENFIAQNSLGRMYLDGVNLEQNNVSALYWFQRAVANRSSDAQIEIALMHLNGQGVEQNLDTALHLLKGAAEESAYANFILGRLYLDNLWLPQDYELALNWLEKAAKLGHINAINTLIKTYASNEAAGIKPDKVRYWLEFMQYSDDENLKLNWATLAIETLNNPKISKAAYQYLLEAKERDIEGAYGILSWIYRSGVGKHFGVPTDEIRAYDIAVEGARRMDHGSFFTLGLLHEFGTDALPISPKLSAENYINALNRGSLSAKFRLGINYLNHATHDAEVAFSLIESAAKEGLIEAYDFLGWAYENGYFTEQNIAMAIKFYRAAADELYATGQYNLSVLLRDSDDFQEQEEGITWLKRAAYNGHSEAQFDLSLYLVDIENDASKKEAVEWAKLSAHSGNPRGISMLAWLLDEGIGTLQNIRESRELFQESANMGDPYSQYRFGRMMFEGNGVPKDTAGGRELLVKACDSLNQEACEYLHSQQSVEGLHIAANTGNSDAQFALGMEYLNGISLQQNIEKAHHWFHSAALKGHTQSQQKLGYLYAYEQGEKPDYIEAKKWFQLAADKGDIQAQIELGLLYEYGNGVAQNYVQAHTWYEHAAKQGSPVAQHNIGLLYAHGRGVKQNDELAFNWFHKSAEQGYIRAIIDLGLAYELGKGIAKSYQEARLWYEVAAEYGDPIAQNNLGLLYEYGRGLPEDEDIAFEYFYKSANQGFVRAQYFLGLYFLNGRGTEKNTSEAIKWFRLAADQGHPDARKRLWSLGVNIPPQKLCKPLDQSGTGQACDIFFPDKHQKMEFDAFLSQSLNQIMEGFIAPKSDGLKYQGKATFCFDKGGLSKVSLTHPAGHQELDQAILKAINKTGNIPLPDDPCIQRMASHLKVTMFYDESDMKK